MCFSAGELYYGHHCQDGSGNNEPVQCRWGGESLLVDNYPQDRGRDGAGNRHGGERLLNSASVKCLLLQPCSHNGGSDKKIECRVSKHGYNVPGGKIHHHTFGVEGHVSVGNAGAKANKEGAFFAKAFFLPGEEAE